MPENILDQSVDNQVDATEAVDSNSAINIAAIAAPQNQNPVIQELGFSNYGAGNETPKQKKSQAARSMIRGDIPKSATMDDFLNNVESIRRQDPLYGTGARTPDAIPIKTYEKFDDQKYGYIPGADNDDFYGKQESWYQTAAKAPLRLSAYTVYKVGEGIGFVAGLASPWNWGTDEGVVSKAADNSMYQFFNYLDEETKNEWLPTFQEAADREKGFWNRAATDGDFWTEDAVDGFAFMASAWIPGIALSKLGLGARALSMLSKVGTLTGEAGVAIEGAEAAANYFSKAQTWAKGLDKFNAWALATTSESMFEAKGVRDKILDNLSYDQYGNQVINPKTNKPYTEQEKGVIAGEGSKNTFVMNAALLGVTNLLEYKYVAKLFGQGEATAAKSILAGTGLAEQATLKTFDSGLKTFAKTAASGIIREGFVEENMQLAIQRINENYGTEGEIKGLLNADTYKDLFGQYTKQSIAGIKGDDKEAAENIGLGAILGALIPGGMQVKQNKDNKAYSEKILASFTDAQNQWLKFGNIYKTEEVVSKDAAGNETKTNRLVLDDKGEPVVDNMKLSAISNGLQLNADLLTASFNEKNKYIQEIKRTSSFANFVIAHINAGLEDTLIGKLDAIAKASPEEMAKLGFAADGNLQNEVNRYKALTNLIINQNKIINSDILLDGSKEDEARKSKLVSIAAQQAIYKSLTDMVNTDVTSVKNQLVTDDMTSLSDGLVDQLNTLKHRIQSQKLYIQDLKENGKDAFEPMDVYEKVLTDLEKSYEKLKTDNKTSLETLKENEDGTFEYEKEERNDILLNNQLNNRNFRKAELLNHTKNIGLIWAKYADIKTGKESFVKYNTALVEDIISKKQAEEAAKAAKDAEAKAQEEKAKEQQGSNEQTDDTTNLASINPTNTEEEVPGLEDYLKEKHKSLLENPAFKLDYDTWRNSGAVNFWIDEYNKKYKTQPADNQQDNQSTDTQDAVDKLSIQDVTVKTLTKAMAAVRKVYDSIIDNSELVQKLKDKIASIKDEFSRIAIMQMLEGKKSSTDNTVSGYTAMPNSASNPEHVGYDTRNLEGQELATGFVLAGDTSIVNDLAGQNGAINHNVKVMATRTFVNKQKKTVADLNIPNRTMVTFETPNDIKKLQKGQSVIAVSSKSQGFGTQIYTKDEAAKGNMYLTGIENYAIVHPDNTTEAVTWSEEQRQFIMANLLVNGEAMTDADFNKLQAIYNKLQDYNAEVEVALGEDTNADVTAIFNKYFTLSRSGIVATKGESFEDVISRSPEKLFTVEVRDDQGNVTQQLVPLIASSRGEVWSYDFPIQNGSIVYTDEQGEVQDVTNFMDYLKEVHGIEPVMTKSFGGKIAWISKSTEVERGYKPYSLSKMTGTEPVELFKGFVKEFNELKESIDKGLATKSFVYKGKTYSTLNDLMKEFNINHYGFYSVKDWIANLHYDTVRNKFVFELRPNNIQLRNELSNQQKKALNLYFDETGFTSITNSTSDEEVKSTYDKWVKKLISDLGKLGKKMETSTDPKIKELRSMLDSRVLFYYEMEGDQKTWMLKLQNKSNSKAPIPFLSYNATTSTGGRFTVTLNETPKVSDNTQESNINKRVTVGTLSDDGFMVKTEDKAPKKKKVIKKRIEDDEAPFMLQTEESYQKYTEDSFNEEVKWLRTALAGTGINLLDLATIIDGLRANKNVLGYYKDQAIYVNKSLSAVGTIYHEAFHGLFRSILNADQRNFYLQKAKEKIGYITKETVDTFRDDRNYTTKTDDEIRDLIAEEYLADGFKDYKLNKKEPAASWFKKFVKTIERIINFFTGNSDAINDLYADLDGGKFANKKAQSSSINTEGVFALAYGRPKLYLEEEDGEASFTADMRPRPLNLDLQNELINKLAYQVSIQSEGTFTEKYNRAVEEIKAQYDIDKLVGDRENAQAIRNKYQELFHEASYVLGVSVPFSLDDEISNDPDALELKTTPGDNQLSYDLIKKEVQSKIATLGISSGLNDNFELPESDEDKAEKEKGGEFDIIHMNPLQGLSREFRSLFSMIPYTYEDKSLGISLQKMADGNMLFNAMIKIAADTGIENILPSLAKAVDTLEEDNDAKSAPLVAFADFLKNQFGIIDLHDPASMPSKNIHLYKQFIDTFFVTELPSYIIKTVTNLTGSRSEVFDASINQDIKNKKEDIKFQFENAYRKLNTIEQKEAFNNNFKALQQYITSSLLQSLTENKINNRKTLNKIVDEVKELMDAVNIKLPKSLLRQSFLAIYSIENELVFNPNSKQNILDMQSDQRLMKEGAYLNKAFFNFLSNVSALNYSNIFVDTKSDSVSVGKDKTSIEGINSILKKATKYIIKYDVNSAISVFQNAENKNIWRYSRYSPPVLLAQLVREKGVEALVKMYPILEPYFKDNSLFDGSAANELFLKNLTISAFGGFRQELGDDARQGVTFGSIDPKTLMLSGIINFMNRERITETVKNEQGEKSEVSIVTFNRSRTQEEATTTNYLITGLYKNYLGQSGKINAEFRKTILGSLQQEYNRIQREWKIRGDNTVVRYNNYNNNIHPVTGQPIEGDSYQVDGKTVTLRAYQFKVFEHFFDDQLTSVDNAELRSDIKNKLRTAAKEGKTFDQALSELELNEKLNTQLDEYFNETFQIYLDELKRNNIVKSVSKPLSKGSLEYVTVSESDLIPTEIKEDFNKGKLQDYGYESLTDLLFDQHLNIFANKLLVNQIFDGDIATGIKSATDYYKRNKSGVISGNSNKTGSFRTSVVEKIQAELDMSDMTIVSKDVTGDSQKDNLVDTADGQSYHQLNHRIRMMDSWGRVDSQVRSILNAYKYRKLTYNEIQTLEDKKVVLNTIKTATGGILEYYKLSEHLISRVDVSHLVIPKGMTQAEVYDTLEDLYSQIEILEDKIVGSDSRPDDIDELESQIEELYNQVHTYWTPKRSKAKLHNLLNSMELDGIDQLFDTNASKKTTVVPSKLNDDGRTNLKNSKSYTSGLFKFMQVETSGIKRIITLPTQARQLLTTYLTRLESDKVFGSKTIGQLAREYSNTLGKISKSSLKNLDNIILDKKGNVDIADLFKVMQNGLKLQGVDSNTLKYFDVKDGVPVHNPNLPVIKQQFTYYYFALFNDAVFSESVSGRSDILVSSYGYEVLYDTEDNNRIITDAEQSENPDKFKSDRYKTRHLGVSVEEVDGKKIYTVEVIIPEPLMNNESERALYLEKLNKFFSTRIPTEDKRSMIVAKVVDYIDASYRNSIIVPQLVHILAGSDLDVDKLYSHTFDYYMDFNNEAHVYGDYSKYDSDSKGRFVEYIQYMLKQPALKNSLQLEIENVSAKPVFNSDFNKLKTELNITDMEFTAEELQESRKQMSAMIDQNLKKKKELQLAHDLAFDSYILAKKTNRVKDAKEVWKEKRVEYLNAKAELDANFYELSIIKEEQKAMENTINLMALVNVLKSKGYPVTQAELTKYSKVNNTPVIPVLQNESLQQKIDLLSNEKVFNSFYINEKSSVESFRQVANSIGASVEDVVKQNSIYSIMGDIVANELNSSNKDGIGISASFNKFLAFAEKTALTLPFNLINLIDENGNQVSYNNFKNTLGIRTIGQTLGMFADAGKDPIPSVLNLNPLTAGVSNVINGMTSNLNIGLLINKLPFIESVINEVSVGRSAVQTNETLYTPSIKNLLNDTVINPITDDLALADRLGELYEKDENGKVVPNKYLKYYIKTTSPNPNFINLKNEEKTLAALGIELQYEDGTAVLEEPAKVFLANLYNDINYLNSDIIRLGGILNLIKDQKPEFGKLDQIISDVEYFLNGDSIFKDEIAIILKSSEEYGPLIEAARKMSDYSKQLLIERSPLFKSINKLLFNGLKSKDAKGYQDISDQIGKFIIINKIKADMRSEIELLKDTTSKKGILKREMLEESFKYFTSDFWINNNTFLDDLDYLYNNNPGNAFVEFIKVNNRKDIDYLEATTRMKLDKDITENIISGYEALQKSLDDRTLKLSRQLFYYLLVKDGLGYGANTFIKYLSPDLNEFKNVSDSLTAFQSLLAKQESYIVKKQTEILNISKSGIKEEEKKLRYKEIALDIYNNYTALFDKFFNNKTRPGKIDWINGILGKIFSFEGNQKYITSVKKVELVESIKELFKDLAAKDVISFMNASTKINGKFYEYLSNAPKVFTLDFNKVVKGSKVTDYQYIFKNLNFAINIDNSLKSVGFPILMQNTSKRVFKLNKIDGVQISEQIALASLPGQFMNLTGLNAEYIEIDTEGTTNLLNFGFTAKDGAELYKHTQPSELDNELLKMGVDLSVLSDNKPASSSSAIADQKGPIDTNGVKILGEDDVVEGMFKKNKAKPVEQTSTTEADDKVGFNLPKADANTISLKEIDDIYRLKNQSVNKNKISITDFRKEAFKFAETLKNSGKTKEEIIEQLKCL